MQLHINENDHIPSPFLFSNHLKIGPHNIQNQVYKTSLTYTTTCFISAFILNQAPTLLLTGYKYLQVKIHTS